MSFISYIKKNYNTIILASYLLPILFAVIVSLAHVVTFWEVTNPASWAIFLSIAIEVAVLSSIAASRISNWAWLPFGIVTFIQIIGNVFFSYTNIDTGGSLFANWVELFDPLFNWLGLGTNGDIIIHKRILATFSGAMIPLISITFFHFFIRTIRMGDEPIKVIEPSDIIKDEPVVSGLFIPEEEVIKNDTEPQGKKDDTFWEDNVASVVKYFSKDYIAAPEVIPDSVLTDKLEPVNKEEVIEMRDAGFISPEAGVDHFFHDEIEPVNKEEVIERRDAGFISPEAGVNHFFHDEIEPVEEVIDVPIVEDIKPKINSLEGVTEVVDPSQMDLFKDGSVEVTEVGGKSQAEKKKT